VSEAEAARVRIELPANLCLLAKVTRRVEVLITGPVTQRSVVDALEAAYPMLKGTIRDHTSKVRRPFIRFFACEQDLSHVGMDEPLPELVAQGKEAFLIIGAIAGG
jgi:molybdopterin synthase sulfur carrier subunit